MYTVKQAADKMNLNVHTLRFYANKELFPELTRDYNNVRIFSEQDLEWIRLVKCLRDVGMPIPEVKRFIELCKQGDSTIKERMEMILEQKAKALAALEETQKSIEMLTKKSNYYKERLRDKSIDYCNPAANAGSAAAQKKMKKTG